MIAAMAKKQPVDGSSHTQDFGSKKELVAEDLRALALLLEMRAKQYAELAALLESCPFESIDAIGMKGLFGATGPLKRLRGNIDSLRNAILGKMDDLKLSNPTEWVRRDSLE